MKIKNRKQLIENAETDNLRKARTLALNSLEHAVNAADPKKLIQTKIHIENSALHAGTYLFDLQKFRNIYVVGGGKASGAMAETTEELLGSRITDGIVNVPYGDKHKTRIIKLHEASHPIPDEAGVSGTRCMMAIAEQAEQDDLLICLISGGGSSLMPLPRDNITLADKQQLTEALLKSGATINEINTVRKHISAFKGGWLAKKAYPATVLNLVLSDVIGDALEFIASGPTMADSSTFADAREILEKYGLWKKTPNSVLKILSQGENGLIPETPKKDDLTFEKVYSVILGNVRTAAEATIQFLKSQGFTTLLLTSTVEGEAKHVGTVLASIANEIAISGNPVDRPAAVVVGGETTVTVTGNGKGGRNQELTLAAALKLVDGDGVAVASLSTDGVDGQTDAAGAIVDCKTLARAERLGLEATKFLSENDSYNFLFGLGDLIVTGQTETNVNDVAVIIVL
jgi:glycerate 2-kinase